MCKNKKGYTLIEVIIYLALVSIIVLIFSTAYTLNNNIRNNIGVQNDISKIHDFLVQSKMTSRNNKVNGTIIYDKNDKSIKYSSSKERFSVILNHVVIDQIYTSKGDERLDISNRGIITTAGTIRVSSQYGEKYTISITVSVGSDTINVKT